MEDTLQSLYKIRELALQKQENERNMLQLRGQLQSKQDLKEMKEENQKTDMGVSRYIIVFVVSYILLMFIINKIFTIIMLVLDSGFSVGLALKASADVNVNPIIGMTLAVPFAFIVTLIVRAIIKAHDKKNNKKNAIENQSNRNINKRIMQNNASTEVNNIQIVGQLTVYEEMQKQLVQELRKTASWYPEIYFTIPAVEYIIQQLEKGKANSVNQAIVHLEAEQKI